MHLRQRLDEREAKARALLRADMRAVHLLERAGRGFSRSFSAMPTPVSVTAISGYLRPRARTPRTLRRPGA